MHEVTDETFERDGMTMRFAALTGKVVCKKTRSPSEPRDVTVLRNFTGIRWP